jgi:hypothetical protein
MPDWWSFRLMIPSEIICLTITNGFQWSLPAGLQPKTVTISLYWLGLPDFIFSSFWVTLPYKLRNVSDDDWRRFYSTQYTHEQIWQHWKLSHESIFFLILTFLTLLHQRSAVNTSGNVHTLRKQIVGLKSRPRFECKSDSTKRTNLPFSELFSTYLYCRGYALCGILTKRWYEFDTASSARNIFRILRSCNHASKQIFLE